MRVHRMASRAVRGSILFLSMVMSTAAALAQTPAPAFPYNVEMIPRRGAQAGEDRVAGAVDSIEVTSGRLGVKIPLAAVPESNVGESFGLSLVYDSNIYEINPEPGTYGMEQRLYAPAAPGGRSPGVPGGWNYNFQVIGPRAAQRYLATPNCNSAEARRRFIYWFVLPDGSAHILHLAGHGDEDGAYSGDGFYEYQISGHRPCNTGESITAGKLIYYTDDGSYLRFEIDATGDDEPAPEAYWTLYYPDGRSISGTGWMATTLRDANVDTNGDGNEIQIENYYESCDPSTVFTDEFERNVTIDYDDDGGPNGAPRDTITRDGPDGGTMTWVVDWEKFSLDGGSGGREYQCGETTNETCRLAVWDGQQYVGRELIVVKYVQLPGTTASSTPPVWNSWAFGYGRDDQSGQPKGFGQLNSIRTPDGAEYKYAYRFDVPVNSSETVRTAADLLHRNGVVARTVTHDGVQDDLPLALDYAVVSGSNLKTTVTAPDGGETIYYYKDPQDLTAWDRGLVTKIEAPLGTETERQWSRNLAYSLSSTSDGNNQSARNNPFIQKQTATAGGANPQTALTAFMIDKNGNLLSRKEYDWGTNFSTNLETANPLRESALTYYVEMPAASAAIGTAVAMPMHIGVPMQRIRAIRTRFRCGG